MLLIAGTLFVASTVRDFLQGSRSDSPDGQDPSTVTYANEDYSPPPVDSNPPPLPGPRDLEAAGRIITANPVYEQSVPSPTRCEMGTVDMRTASTSTMETHLNELMGCLMRVWDQPVTDAGFEMPRPSVTVYDRPITTACGSLEEVNATYCGGDQRVYYAQPLLEAFPEEIANTPYAAEMILGHEFGHAVQARTALLISEKALAQQASSEAKALDLSRRIEVQADCFAGHFINSVAVSQGLDATSIGKLGRLAYNLGDDILTGESDFSAEHGTGSTRENWFIQGTESTSISTCNTFIVSPDEVR